MTTTFFEKYPKTLYNLNNENTLDVITNLTVNFSFSDSITENSVSYYEYNVSDGETPESIAYNLYGRADYHWIILKANKIVNVIEEWPLEDRSLMNYIDKKYEENAGVGETGLQWAQQNYKKYIKIETRTYVLSGEKNVQEIEIDEDEYNSITPSSTTVTLPDGIQMIWSKDRSRKTYYEYEMDLNESKRNIKIIKPEFVNFIYTEFTGIMNNE